MMNRMKFAMWAKAFICAGLALVFAASAATAQLANRPFPANRDVPAVRDVPSHRDPGGKRPGIRFGPRMGLPDICPPGTVGLPPRCMPLKGERADSKHCPKGYKQVRSRCVKVVNGAEPRVCPPGTKRKHRKCVPVTETTRNCPEGTRGKPPHCVKINTASTDTPANTCPPGMKGRPPRCERIDPGNSPGIYAGALPGQSVPPPPGGNTAQTADTPGGTPGQLPRLTPPTADVPRFRPNELVVLIRSPQPDNVAATLAQSFNVNLQETVTLNLLPNVRVYRFRIPDNRSVEGLAASMSTTPDVSAMPNFYHRLQADEPAASPPPKPRSSNADQMPQYALPKMNVPDAQAIATGKGVTIAVIDSGVDAKHPVFSNSKLQLFDMVENGSMQPDKHGTAIAGLIAGRGSVKGVAPDANVLAVRAFAPEGENMPPVTTSVRLARAVDVAFEKGARVFNMSFAGPRDQLLIEMIDAAHAKGAIFVAAAGNEGPGAPPAFPAAYDKVIAITATDESDKLYAKANRGRYVTAAAPGVDILAPVTGNGFDYESGTSFAAAHVSGIVALLMERNPRLTPEEVRQILVGTAQRLTKKEPTEENEDYGAGLADALASVRKAQVK